MNFLSLLRAGHEDDVLTAGALDSMDRHKLPQALGDRLDEGRRFGDPEQGEAYLRELGLADPRHVRIATDGALMGSVLEHGVSAQLGIVSDEAGQFNVFRHALCWIHGERNITELIPLERDPGPAQGVGPLPDRGSVCGSQSVQDRSCASNRHLPRRGRSAIR